ncbi:MAG: V-type ATPase 116kDa subunit family protein [Lachnospiraceae bacterium]
MIENMSFINIMGPKDDFDRVVQNYLSKYDMQLENALSELKTVHNIKPFIDTNPYEESLKICEGLVDQISDPEKNTLENAQKLTIKDAAKFVEKINTGARKLEKKKSCLETELKAKKESLERILPYRELRYNISSILEFKFIKFRFGKFQKEYFEKFKKTIYAETLAIFCECYSNKEYVWGVYFTADELTDRIDTIFSSLHFERIYLPDEYEGTTEEACTLLERQISILEKSIEKIKEEKKKYFEEYTPILLTVKEKLTRYSVNFNVRKMAACTDDEESTYFILCGWMSYKDAEAFKKEIANDKKITCYVEEEHQNIFSKPPTELKNPKIFRPFEMFIRMYGLPAYNEIDPTIFVALTYSFIFGIMFGDVGQGLCLAIGGFILYKKKKMDLAAIVGSCGIFSTIFGFLFGSFFGFEDVIAPVWIRPASYMATVPFIGKLNYIFIVTVAFGMFIILLSMVFNMINSFKERDLTKAFMDTNGAAGFVFFAAIVLVIVLFMTGNSIPAGIALGVMFGIPLLLIALKEPITNLVEKKAELLPDGKGMFVVQTFFELFEVLLSYFSNTLSFVRIGAFAVSHASMMEVVLMLAGAEEGNPNWFVIVLGNLFVCGLEGLIVGIQVLRLEYYEMFSRFYRGTGREFKPYRTQENTAK